MTTHEPERTTEEKLAIALKMLAEWCIAVEQNGSGWDDWDEYYKDAAYREGPLRKDLDSVLYEVRKNYDEY